MFATLTARKQRYMVAEIDTSTGVERISRTLALDATGAGARELIGDELAMTDGGREDGVLVLDPRPGVRVYVLPLIDGVIARWDLLLEAHRRRSMHSAADTALRTMGERPRTETEPLAEWLVAGAADSPPRPGVHYVPELKEPVTHAEWFGMERRAQLLARVLPIARELNPGDPLVLARFIVSRLVDG